MKTLLLPLALLLPLSQAAFAAPAATNANSGKSGSTWKLTACKKACIPAHDSKVIACKTVKTKEGKACVAKADRERRECEAACSRPAPAKPAPAPGKT